MTPLLEFSSVGFGYDRGAPVLEQVSFDVGRGQGVALLGPNGAGKTTITRLAMAMLQPDQGQITTVGRPARSQAPEDLADVVGYVFQRPEAQLIERTVAAEVGFGPRQLGWASERVSVRVGEVLAELDLEAEAETHPYDLPVGRRRLVALAAALMTEPQLLILDEPTAGLDREARKILHRSVRARLERGVGVLAVTHDMEFAVEVLSWALVLDQRRVVRNGDLAEVLREARNLGISLPAPARLAERIRLQARSWRAGDVTRALVERCRPGGRSLS